MVFTSLQPYSILICGAVIIVFLILLCSFYIKFEKKLTFLKEAQYSNQLSVSELQLTLSVDNEQLSKQVLQLNKVVTENDQVSKQLEHRIKILQQQNQQLQTHLEQLQEQQPEDKLYLRASKLVALGADLNEIMQECDIPKAEAEMLLSMHRK